MWETPEQRFQPLWGGGACAELSHSHGAEEEEGAMPQGCSPSPALRAEQRGCAEHSRDLSPAAPQVQLGPHLLLDTAPGIPCH